MKTIGVSALRKNPELLSQSAAAGEYVLVTNRSEAVSLAVPFNADLLQAGVHVSLAIRLFEDGTLSLAKAAKLAKMPIESFLQCLGRLGIAVVDQSTAELEDDLKTLS
ncbi:MAG: UPF0175 family protein [Hahellaceae bacterium]|nr:UPF0175 family protein [Hahellaceae bacterium]